MYRMTFTKLCFYVMSYNFFIYAAILKHKFYHYPYYFRLSNTEIYVVKFLPFLHELRGTSESKLKLNHNDADLCRGHFFPPLLGPNYIFQFLTICVSY